MKKNSLLFLTIFLVGIIQATALDYLPVLGAKPDLLLICVIFLALYSGQKEGIKAAIFGGLFKDITSTAVFGSNAFGFCLCALFLARFGNSFYKQKILIQMLLCGLLYCIITYIVLIANYAKAPHIHISDYSWMILKASLYTGCISPLIFFILSKVFGSVEYQGKYI